MLTIFNRKELVITFSLEEQSIIRDILDKNNINYSIKTVNRSSPSSFSASRGRTGTFGQNLDISYEYIIYVNKSDYDEAISLINRKSRN